jgi:glycosyltransferase involved in cell wall biosynthesis
MTAPVFAIDVTSVPLLPTGVGNYILQLVIALAPQVKEDGSRLHVFGRSDQRDLDELKETAFIDCGAMNRLQRMIFEQTVLPGLIVKHSISLLHSPNYSIPFFASCKRVCTIHDLTCFLYPQRRKLLHGMYFRHMIRYSAYHADLVITVSENTANDLRCLFSNSNVPVRTIYQGYNRMFRKMDVVQTEGILSQLGLEHPFFLFVGTIEPSKNIERLIDAFRLFSCNAKRPFELIIVGKRGWDVKTIFRAIEKVSVSCRVRYLGYIDNEKLRALYSGARAFIYPSLYEGFGLPPLEAMSCETPVACSNASSIPEAVGDAAILFDPLDVNSIAAALHQISNDETLRSDLIRKGRKRLEMFAWHDSARKVLSIYHEVMDTTKPGL